MTAGTYTLVVHVAESMVLDVGALGYRRFPPGWYAYTGSAHGPGGFARVDRHRAVAAGAHTVTHWHIDYLLGSPEATINTVVKSPDVDAECAINSRLIGDRITGFGASDCDCVGHLARADSRPSLVRSVTWAHTTGGR